MKEPRRDDYGMARAIVVREQKCSVILLQRRMNLGYAPAARLVHLLVQAGVVSLDYPSRVLIQELEVT